MSSPLQFYRAFKGLMTEHGIRHVLTSGMACVEYGIQQTTKDTDWIIHCGDVLPLVEMLQGLEPGLSGSNWRVSYRPLFGAPLLEEYLASGWTSHLAIQDSPDSPEHHLDFFGQPPRLTAAAAFTGARDGIAERLVIAQMKKTDRDKDWPIVEALSQQAALTHDPAALLQTRDPDLMSTLWAAAPESTRADLLIRRPLLCELTTPAHGLRKCLAVERALWENVNKLRYRRFQSEWKEFLRRWRRQDDFAWPASCSFTRQHQLVLDAVHAHALPLDPLGGREGRIAIREKAAAEVAEIFSATPSLIAAIMPPLEEMLP